MVALGEGAFGIQIIDDEGVKGALLIIVDTGVEGIPEKFISDSVLMVGQSQVWEVEIYVPHLLTLRLLEGGFGKGSRHSGNFNRRRD